MTEELKKKILTSNLITSLITSNNVIAIYLGGSRLLQLDSPESDYDIVVLTKNKSLLNYQGTPLHIDDYIMHLNITSLTSVLEAIKNPLTLTAFNTNLALASLFLLSDEFIIYKTSKFIKLKDAVVPYIKPLGILSLENILNILINKMPTEYLMYTKNYFYYLTTYFQLNNLLETNKIYLTEAQRNTLIKLKTTRRIPEVLILAIENRYPHKYFTSQYSYSDIYKELKKYE
jgi:hypothetical protein